MSPLLLEKLRRGWGKHEMILAAEILSKRGLKVLKWPADSQVTVDFDDGIYEIQGPGSSIRLPLWHAYLRWGFRKLSFSEAEVDIICRLAIGER